MSAIQAFVDKRNAVMASAAIGMGVAGWLAASRQDWPLLVSPQASSGIAFVLLLACIAYLTWRTATRSARQGARANDERHLTGTAVTILGAIAVLSGLATLIVVQGELRSNAAHRLADMAAHQAAVFGHSLQQEVELVEAVSKQWGLHSTLSQLNEHRLDHAAMRHLREVVTGISAHGFTALEIYAIDGQPLVEQGDMRIGQATVRLPLKGESMQLLWDNGLVLHSRTVIAAEGRRLGLLVTEMRLNTLTGILRDLQRTGNTTDVLLCGRRWSQAVCMPSRFHAGNTHIPIDHHGQASQPISKSLIGLAGTSSQDDLRGVPVQAGFAPVGGFDLGIEVKTDLEELYEPLRNKLHEALAVMIAVVACGTWLLRSRIAPLANQLAAERQRLRGILAATHDAFAALDGMGRIVDWNPQAEKMFGRPREAVLGQPVSILFAIAQKAGGDMVDMLTRLGGDAPITSARQTDVMAVKQDGSAFPIELSVSPITEAGAQRYALFMHDISQREQAQRLLADREKRLLDVTNSVPALIGHFDANEVCTFANDRALHILGLNRSELPGLTLRAALSPDNYRQHEPGIRKVLAGEPAMIDGQIPYKGRTAYFQAQMVPDKDEHGQVRGFYLMTFDVSPLKESEMKLAQGKQRLRTITDNLPVLISYIDENQRFQFANGTFKEWLDVDPQALRNQHVAKVIGEELYKQRQEQMVQALRGQKISFEVESEARGIRRHLQTTYLPDFRADGSVAGIYTLSTDITKLKRIEQRLSLLARFDTLTGLPNRRQLDEKLNDAMARCARTRKPMAVMYLDIDQFKGINDSIGHAGGDEVLKEFAQRLLSCTRRTDTVARLAGDEFVIILEGMNTLDEPQFIARKIIATITGTPFDLPSGPLAVSTSVGVAVHNGTNMPGARLLAQADEALYDAKRSGRNTFRLAERLQSVS